MGIQDETVFFLGLLFFSGSSSAITVTKFKIKKKKIQKKQNQTLTDEANDKSHRVFSVSSTSFFLFHLKHQEQKLKSKIK